MLLSRIIERGLSAKEGDKQGALSDIFSKEALQELSAFADDCLNKAGLAELNAKLKELDSK